MRRYTLVLGLAAVMMLGVGCTLPPLPEFPFLSKDIAADEVDLAPGSTIVLEQISVNPLEKFNDQPDRVLTFTDWAAHEHVTFHWLETFNRETAESITAREAADRVTPVGQEPNIPEPVYETISFQGSLKSDALDDGDRILLPSAWPTSDTDIAGKPNTIIWLSKKQYEELNATRHTHLTIGSVDAGLQTAADVADSVKKFIEKFTGSGDTTIADQDITEIKADAAWGTYSLTWNDSKVSVQTIKAENTFAYYTVLANSDNPLILEVKLKPWAYGTEALGVLNTDLKISGYKVTKINTP